MELGLENSRVLITGSSRGIGHGIAVSFLEEGAIAVLTGRDEKDLTAAQDAFDAAVMARREAEIANYKTTIAQNSFQPPEPNPGEDTGITGHPAEVEEE